MKNHGKIFEDNFKSGLSTLKQKNIVMRIADSGGQNAGDFLVLTKNRNYLIECKSTKSDRFRLSLIKPHQIDGLKQFHRAFKNNVGVLAIEFDMWNTAFLISIKEMFEIVEATGKKSFSHDELCSYGFIQINKIKTKYIDGYDMSVINNEHLEWLNEN